MDFLFSWFDYFNRIHFLVEKGHLFSLKFILQIQQMTKLLRSILFNTHLWFVPNETYKVCREPFSDAIMHFFVECLDIDQI